MACQWIFDTFYDSTNHQRKIPGPLDHNAQKFPPAVPQQATPHISLNRCRQQAAGRLSHMVVLVVPSRFMENLDLGKLE